MGTDSSKYDYFMKLLSEERQDRRIFEQIEVLSDSQVYADYDSIHNISICISIDKHIKCMLECKMDKNK